ncbi:NAD-dependent succinate-semialdehyde dehydrogenase [Thalassospira permensis]|uniref:Succinate-semialdehyde dehdyrogenase n=1 Tax=Thalassospira permensis NBRC 106175 TaxID=1353532 RepID=A0ABR4TIL7_9PROT|nr:NAD-dependent succinate-semialdehyde dehydrogenase [Thalassospira permensis]KEO51091.1 succinate-semialdehyde dehdyrogenase [Thalassospira permensis NBRC 106175]
MSAVSNAAPDASQTAIREGRSRARKLIADWNLDKAFINGEWARADSREAIDVYDPATGKVIGDVPFMRTSEARRAIDAADAAFPAWSRMLAKERSGYIKRWRDLLEQYQDDLAALITLEQGKPYDQALREVVGAIAYAEWYAEEAKRAYGQTMPATQRDRRVVVQKHPVGVVAAITPWNFPLTMVVRKCAPALAAGCTIVVKPAEDTPISALAAAKLAEMAGFPAGVFNIVTGQPMPIGEALTGDPRVRMLSFTGSTEVGKRLMVQCAPTVKKLSLELGGNAPFIVMDDADIDAAVAGAMISKFRNSGQTCVCANRIFVQDGVYESFVEKFIAASHAQSIGNGFIPGTDIGPLINRQAVAKVERLIDDAKKRGAIMHYGADRPEEGHFIRSLVMTDVPLDADCFNEELFAPVAPIYRFRTEAEVIELSNRVRAGLSSYLFSRDIGRIQRIADGLESGVVGINDGTTSHEGAPFGGVKESGQGREGGHWGLEEYLEPKYLNYALG